MLMVKQEFMYLNLVLNCVAEADLELPILHQLCECKSAGMSPTPAVEEQPGLIFMYKSVI